MQSAANQQQIHVLVAPALRSWHWNRAGAGRDCCPPVGRAPPEDHDEAISNKFDDRVAVWLRPTMWIQLVRFERPLTRVRESKEIRTNLRFQNSRPGTQVMIGERRVDRQRFPASARLQWERSQHLSSCYVPCKRRVGRVKRNATRRPFAAGTAGYRRLPRRGHPLY